VNVTASVIPDPLAVRDPPVIDSPPLIVELAATVNPPPAMARGSSAVMLFTDSTFELIVTVTPVTLMTSSSPEAGTVSVLQLLATSHEPPDGEPIDDRQELARVQDLRHGNPAIEPRRKRLASSSPR